MCKDLIIAGLTLTVILASFYFYLRGYDHGTEDCMRATDPNRKKPQYTLHP